MKPHLTYAHKYWEMLVHPGDTVIDATLGNGHDTCFLARLLQGGGKLVGYDIQPLALEKAAKRLEELPEALRGIVSLRLQSHEYFEERGVKLIVYNLGYLPGGNKALTTLRSTTLTSLANALECLSPSGAISITCYPGHEEGKMEEECILEFLKELPSDRWHICYHQWINRPLAPSLIWLESACLNEKTR